MVRLEEEEMGGGGRGEEGGGYKDSTQNAQMTVINGGCYEILNV